MKKVKEDAWKQAKRLCRLSQEDIRMAKELGFTPKALVSNIPSPSQRWKAPVKEWIHSLHGKKFGAKKHPHHFEPARIEAHATHAVDDDVPF